ALAIHSIVAREVHHGWPNRRRERRAYQRAAIQAFLLNEWQQVETVSAERAVGDDRGVANARREMLPRVVVVVPGQTNLLEVILARQAAGALAHLLDRR